jgi:hypothetical protein
LERKHAEGRTWELIATMSIDGFDDTNKEPQPPSKRMGSNKQGAKKCGKEVTNHLFDLMYQFGFVMRLISFEFANEIKKKKI